MVVRALALPAAMNERLEGDRTIAPATLIETNALCEFVSLIVMLQLPGARGVTVKVTGEIPFAGATLAMVPALGLQVSLSVSAPV